MDISKLLEQEGWGVDYQDSSEDPDDALIGATWNHAITPAKKSVAPPAKQTTSTRKSLDQTIQSGIWNNSRVGAGADALQSALLSEYGKDSMRIVSLVNGARKKEKTYTIQRLCTDYLRGNSELNQKDFTLLASVYCTAAEVMQQTGTRTLTPEQELLARALAPAQQVYKHAHKKPKDIRAHLLNTKYAANAFGNQISLKKTKTGYTGEAVIGDKQYSYKLSSTDQRKIDSVVAAVYTGISATQYQKVQQQEYARLITTNITKQVAQYLTKETAKCLAKKDYESITQAIAHLDILKQDKKTYSEFVTNEKKKIATALEYCIAKQQQLSDKGSIFRRKSKKKYTADLHTARAYLDAADALKQHTPMKSVSYAYLRQSIDAKINANTSCTKYAA